MITVAGEALIDLIVDPDGGCLALRRPGGEIEHTFANGERPGFSGRPKPPGDGPLPSPRRVTLGLVPLKRLSGMPRRARPAPPRGRTRCATWLRRLSCRRGCRTAASSRPGR